MPVTESIVRIRFTDRNKERFEPPLPQLEIPQRKSNKNDYEIMVTQDSHLVVTRKSTGVKLFDTDLKRLIYADQVIQLQNALPAKYLFGLGEHKVNKSPKPNGMALISLGQMDIE